MGQVGDSGKFVMFCSRRAALIHRPGSSPGLGFLRSITGEGWSSCVRGAETPLRAEGRFLALAKLSFCAAQVFGITDLAQCGVDCAFKWTRQGAKYRELSTSWHPSSSTQLLLSRCSTSTRCSQHQPPTLRSGAVADPLFA